MSQLLVPFRKIHRYGWKRSLPRMFEPTVNVGGIQIRSEVDPRDVLGSLVENQWALGSCTANATASCFRYDAIMDGSDPGQLCRFGIYFGERQIEGSLGQGDTGAEGHDAFTVAQAGIPLETAWPYEWSGMTDDQAPDASVFDPSTEPESYTSAPAAYTLRKQVATVPQTQQACQAVLSNNQTIAIGFTVYESFESSEVASSGIVPMPQQGEQVLGGHEVLVVGYLQSEPNYALVMNSWGTGWGLKGFFLMPWQMVCNSQITGDLRTIVRSAA